MDATQFDRLAIAAARVQRRAALGWLAGTALGAALGAVPHPPAGFLPGEGAAEAKGKHRKRRKRKKDLCPAGVTASDLTCGCGAGYVPVQGGCCPQGHTVPCGGTKCCPDGSSCCGDNCCAGGSGCCGGVLCQPPTWECCTQDCGGPGNPCPPRRAAVCAPLEECCFVNSAVGFICCPVGFHCNDDGEFGRCV